MPFPRSPNALWLLFPLFACAHAPRPVAPGERLDVAAFLARVEKAHAVPVTLMADAKAFVDAPQNGGRYALRLAVRRSASLRIEANTPLGDPAAILVADQGRFALLDLRANVFYRGPASPENLARLLPAPFTADELVALLTGTFAAPPGATASVERKGEGFVLTFAAGSMRDEISLGADLRVNEVRRSSRAGALLWLVRLEEHDDSSGAQVPRLLHLSVPGRQTELDLRLRDITANQPPPHGAFLLGTPKGMQVEEVP